MLILSEVGNSGWFKRDKEFASSMGLVPNVYQSGERLQLGWLAEIAGKPSVYSVF